MRSTPRCVLRVPFFIFISMWKLWRLLCVCTKNVRQWIWAKQMEFVLFSWTHKCRHHHLCYNVTHSTHTDRECIIYIYHFFLSLSHFARPISFSSRIFFRLLHLLYVLCDNFSRSLSIFIDFNFLTCSNEQKRKISYRE